ncbi:MAG: GIY-YIG nuclease family protein [Bacteroidota bacterium]
MKFETNRLYYVYILTNKARTVLYIGVTNSLKRRLAEHRNPVNCYAFTCKYNVFYLVHVERYAQPLTAINREKQIKKWNREKKNNLITQSNPAWSFLNDQSIE